MTHVVLNAVHLPNERTDRTRPPPDYLIPPDGVIADSAGNFLLYG